MFFDFEIFELFVRSTWYQSVTFAASYGDLYKRKENERQAVIKVKVIVQLSSVQLIVPRRMIAFR